jgi:XTP/dITP diphosphohydrolase
LPPAADPARVLLATRSEDKAHEIRAILGAHLRVILVSLTEAGFAPAPEEEAIEAFNTFQENALAKARYFAARTGMTTIADDSGICVQELNGAPGVRSRRFAASSSTGEALDAANNAELLRRLEGVPEAKRKAQYTCAAALVTAGKGSVVVAVGTCSGVILTEPAGCGGFGYDPLFLLPNLGVTFGQLPQDEKNRISHRARAFRALAALWPL